jgi:hypothetical protein
MNNHSYIPAALEAISGYKNRDGDITNFSMRTEEETNSPTLLNAILVAHERTIDASTDHKFNGGPAPLCAPIAFLDYVQGIMNKVSGLARRDMLGKRQPEYGNGIDFSQELTDQIGFSVDPTRISELVDEDFYVLNNLHCYIAQAMPYLTDIKPLHYHAENLKLDDGNWIIDNVADDFDDAISIFEKKSEEYKAEQQKVREGNANTIDLTARAEHRPKGAKPAKQKKAA